MNTQRPCGVGYRCADVTAVIVQHDDNGLEARIGRSNLFQESHNGFFLRVFQERPYAVAHDRIESNGVALEMRGVLDHLGALLKAPHPHGIGPVLGATSSRKPRAMSFGRNQSSAMA